MHPYLTRRDFLKLSSLLSLLSFPITRRAVKALENVQVSDQRNILIFVFDALSAEHMPLYGYTRNTTPNLARFADRAAVYHSHYAGGNFTTPGTASLLMGVYPWNHRAIHLYGTALEFLDDNNIFSALSSDGFSFAYTHNLLVETLLHQMRESIDLFKHTRDLAIFDPEYSDRIFDTDYGISLWGEQLILRGAETKPSSLFGSILFRIKRLYESRKIADRFGRQFPYGVPNLDDIYFILEDAMDWLIKELPAFQKPFLGYFHILPPHDPYNPRKDFVGIFKDDWKPIVKPPSIFSQGYSDDFLNSNRLKYDEYLAYADSEFGRLYDSLVQAGTLENTIVLVTSDHGELFERGIMGHQTPTLYEPLIHIPLMIAYPGQTQRQDIVSLTSCVDVLPTLAKLTGNSVPGLCEGEVLPGFREEPVQDDRSVFSVEAKSSPKHGSLSKLTVAARKANYKLIYYRDYPNTPVVELYDLSEDPDELVDIKNVKPSIATDLQNEIENKLRQTNSL
jgi:arylsulfatase A-like enzyme